MGAKVMRADNDRNIQEMVAVASAFCRLIETLDESDSSWLQQMAGLLPRLQAAVGTLQELDANQFYLVNSDLDKRFEIYSRLHDRLGANDSYWLQFDVARDGQSMSGSLADDLTDIYCDLKSGLTHQSVI